MLVPLPTGISISKTQLSILTDRFIDQFAQSIGERNLKERIVYRESFGPNEFRSSFNAWQAPPLVHRIFSNKVPFGEHRTKVKN